MASVDAQDGGKAGGLIGFVIVTIVALGFGAGFGLFISDEPKTIQTESDAETAGAKARSKAAAVVPATSRLVALPPLVVNLAAPRNTWIRIEASLLVDEKAEGADVLAARLAEDFVAYLRTASLSQFEGPSGFQNLREDLVDRAMIRGREHIKDVIVHGVVVE